MIKLDKKRNPPTRRSLVKQNPSSKPTSSSVSGLMLPLRSSVYIHKSEPGNERGSAHFGNFPAARGFVYQLRRCETSRGDERRRHVFHPMSPSDTRGHRDVLVPQDLLQRPSREVRLFPGRLRNRFCPVQARKTQHFLKYQPRLEIAVRHFKVRLQRNHCVQIVALPNHQ